MIREENEITYVFMQQTKRSLVGRVAVTNAIEVAATVTWLISFRKQKTGIAQ